MNRRKQRILCGVLLCVNILFIWGNSMLPASASGEISGELMRTGLGKLFAMFGEVGEYILRKAGHFTEFGCLGLLLIWMFDLLKQKGIHRLALPLLCGTMVACVDETIQIFSLGRSSSLIDVWIDVAGVCAGMILLLIGQAIHKKRKNN